MTKICATKLSFKSENLCGGFKTRVFELRTFIAERSSKILISQLAIVQAPRVERSTDRIRLILHAWVVRWSDPTLLIAIDGELGAARPGLETNTRVTQKIDVQWSVRTADRRR